jgi:hypothetical protein
LDVLCELCRERHRACHPVALAEKTRREVSDVEDALGALVQVGIARREEGGELFRLSGSEAVWRFADDFLESYCGDPAYTAQCVMAMTSNLRLRACRVA